MTCISDAFPVISTTAGRKISWNTWSSSWRIWFLSMLMNTVVYSRIALHIMAQNLVTLSHKAGTYIPDCVFDFSFDLCNWSLFIEYIFFISSAKMFNSLGKIGLSNWLESINRFFWVPLFRFLSFFDFYAFSFKRNFFDFYQYWVSFLSNQRVPSLLF